MRAFTAAFVFAGALQSVAVGATLSPADLLAHPAAYDGQIVSVSGMVTDRRDRVSRRGNAYTTFDLCTASSCVRVFEWGNAGVQDGQSTTVRGTFAAVKRVGRYTFRDEIDVGQ